MDWQRFLNHPPNKIYELMDSLAIKQFRDSETARTAADICLERLQAENWSRLNKFEGRNDASAKTYFATVFKRLLIDYQRERYGRCTAPKKIKDKGALWVKIHKELCCQKLPAEQLVHVYSRSNINIDIYKAISFIKENDPKCEERNVPHKVDSLSESGDTAPIEPEDTSDHQASFFNLVLHDIYRWQNQEDLDTEDLDSEPLNQCLKGLKLDNVTIILLKVVYQEGLSFAKASKIVQIPPKKAQKMVEDAIDQIRKCFENSWI